MKFRAVIRTLPAAALMTFAVLASGCGGSSGSNNQVTNPPGVTEPFDSGNLGNGAKFVHLFPAVGSFSYRCKIHGNMTGTITVAAAGGDSALVSIAGFAFSAAAPIRPGGYVKWTNNDGTTHTVTRP